MSNQSGDFYEFGPFRLEPAERLLLRHGKPLSVPPKAFAALVILVERGGRVVGKEELMRAVWPETFVEENNLTQCIFTLRRVLDEKNNGHSFIETVPKLGYRFVGPVSKSIAGTEADGIAYLRNSRARIVIRQVEQSVAMDEPAIEDAWPGADALAVPGPATAAAPKESGFAILRKRRTIYPVMGGLCLVVVVAFAYGLFRPRAALRVLDYAPISREVNPVGPVFSDGVHLYFTASTPGGVRLAQMSVLGGEPTFLSPTAPVLKLQLDDLSPGGTEFLVLKEDAGTGEEELWIQPVPAGSPRPAGNLKAHASGWSPGGDRIVFANGNSLYVAQRDGNAVRELARLPGPARNPRWSPDGRWIRFMVPQNGTNFLWEVAADGTRLRLLLHDAGLTADGAWSSDSKYFVFTELSNGSYDLWAIPETEAWSDDGNATPVRLTNGQLNFALPASARDGKHIFALGMLSRVEIMRHDSRTNSFAPYLEGVSADSLAFSSDGQWVAYSTFPERALWRSRIDGSERMQLTFAPMEALLPRWSPDGKTVAFAARSAGSPWKIHVIPMAGGSPRPIAEIEGDQATPAWSGDGNTLAFAGAPWITGFAFNSTAIHCLDLRNRQVSTLPGSEGLWSPRWSPDGRYLVAETIDSQELKLFDFRTRQWSSLARVSNSILGYSAWSRDSKSVYFNAYGETSSGIYRVPVGGKHHVELALDLKNVPHADTLGRWFTLDPKDSPLVLHDTSIRRIYALELQSH